MAGPLDQRFRGFESKWAHDDEIRFRVIVHRNRLLGLWAAAEMGLSGRESEDFVTSVVNSDFEEPGEEDVFRKLRNELAKRVSDSVIREKMEGLLPVAAEYILDKK